MSTALIEAVGRARNAESQKVLEIPAYAQPKTSLTLTIDIQLCHDLCPGVVVKCGDVTRQVTIHSAIETAITMLDNQVATVEACAEAVELAKARIS